MNIQKPSHRKCQLGGVKWIALFAYFLPWTGIAWLVACVGFRRVFILLG